MMPVDEFSRDLDWNLLKIFHEIAHARGISKASEKTRLKQSAISLALKRLEGQVGAVLCRRGSGGFELTSEGMLLAELCAPIMSAVREIPSITTKSSSEVHGKITIGLISNFTYPVFDEALSVFHTNFSSVEIVISTMPWATVLASLIRNEIDVGIASTNIKHPELRYRFLCREVHRPYCGVRHGFFGKEIGDPGQLSDEKFVLTGSDEPDELRDFRLHHGLGSNVSAVTEHLEEAKRLAILGVGVTFLPESYASYDMSCGRLWPLLHHDISPSIEVYTIDNPAANHLARRRKLREEFVRCIEELTTAEMST